LNQRTVDHFRALEKELRKRSPKKWKEAKVLAKQIADPETADVDAIWAHVWKKPLYANTKVAIGDANVEKLASYMDKAWKHWGAEGDKFCITRIGKGRSTAAFQPNRKAQRIRDKTGIAMYRLFAIQGAAGAMRIRSKRSKTPYADLVDLDPEQMIMTVQREMGWGWGHITVLHFLTDLGLACKPDLWLVCTVRYLGMAKLKEKKVPTLAEAITINHCVRCLVERLYDSFSPARLRYVDKILMEISKQKLI
jgi:hypothetical protein